MADLQELRRLAEEAAAENDVESDWFDPVLIESDEPVLSSRKARRFIAAMTPQMAMRLILLADRAHGAQACDCVRPMVPVGHTCWKCGGIAAAGMPGTLNDQPKGGA